MLNDVCMVDSRLRDLTLLVLKRSVPITTGLCACLDNSTLCLDYAEFQGNTSFFFFLIYSFSQLLDKAMSVDELSVVSKNNLAGLSE